MGWTYLFIAGLFEVVFATCLKACDNFTRIWPMIGFILGAIISLYFLSKAMQTIPMGTAYAVWTGIGSVGTVIIGVSLYDDPVNIGRLFFLAVLIFSLIGFTLFSAHA